VLVVGAKAPKCGINENWSLEMRPGNRARDISVDQGGCFEDTRRRLTQSPVQVHELIFSGGEHAGRRAAYVDATPGERYIAHTLELASTGWREQ